MKKLLVMMWICSFVLFGCSNKESTMNQKSLSMTKQIEEAMEEVHMDFEEMIHIEAVHDGVMVFYLKEEELYGGFIQHTDEGWEWVRGGGVTSLTPEKGYNKSGHNFPDFNFNILYGVISDPTIKNVEFEDGSRKAKIITTENGLRLWIIINKEEIEFGNKIIPSKNKF